MHTYIFLSSRIYKIKHFYFYMSVKCIAVINNKQIEFIPVNDDNQLAIDEPSTSKQYILTNPSSPPEANAVSLSPTQQTGPV